MTFLKPALSSAEANNDEYSTTISGASLPKYRIPKFPSEPHAVFDLVRDELFMDGNSRQNVATFCTTYADDEVRRLMDLSIDKNMIDKDEYPQTAEIEKRCVHMLADLACAAFVGDNGMLDNRFERSLHAGWTRSQVAMEEAPPG